MAIYERVDGEGKRATVDLIASGAVCVTILGGIITWAISVESRLSRAAEISAVTRRVEQLEQALLPVLIETRVRALTQIAAPAPAPPVPPKALPKISFDDAVHPDRIRGDAEKWARSQLPNVMDKK